jgi:hypothetical protein
MTGSYGITSEQEKTLGYLESKLESGKALTDLQKIDYNDLMEKKLNPQLSKTCISELRKIHREEKYNRVFRFTNKYVQKGIQCEEDAITLLSLHLNIPLIKYKGDRAFGSHFQGMPDIVRKEEGDDVKSSWSLATFPFAGDPLDSIYEWQNIAYMDLFKKEKWNTWHCLINATERMVFNEKQKFFYSMGQPDLEDPIYKEICKEVEKSMIFDIARFKRDYPFYEWENEELDFDIPESERIVGFEVVRDEDKIKEAKDRVEACRAYLKTLK